MTATKATRKPTYYSDEKYGSLFGEYLRDLQRAGRPLPKLRRTPRRIDLLWDGTTRPGRPSLKMAGLAPTPRSPVPARDITLTTPSASAMGPGSSRLPR